MSNIHDRLAMVNLYISGRVIIMSAEQSLKIQIIQKAWEDAEFKKQLLANPKAAIKDAFGLEIPDSYEIEALEETSNKLYLVIPENPTSLKDEPTVLFPMWP